MQVDTPRTGTERDGTLREFVDRFQHAVYGHVRARLFLHTAAEDVTRETFRKLAEKLDRGAEIPDVRQTLMRIADGLLEARLREIPAGSVRDWLELCQRIDREPPSTGDSAPGVDPDRLADCLAELGPSARQALELSYAANRSPAEIAQHLKRSESAVQLLLRQARQALLRCLAGNGPDSA